MNVLLFILSMVLRIGGGAHLADSKVMGPPDQSAEDREVI
jgi:hypothetical protein